MSPSLNPYHQIISSDRLDIIAENNIGEAPDLVVEILSEATKTTGGTNSKNP